MYFFSSPRMSFSIKTLQNSSGENGWYLTGTITRGVSKKIRVWTLLEKCLQSLHGPTNSCTGWIHALRHGWFKPPLLSLPISLNNEGTAPCDGAVGAPVGGEGFMEQKLEKKQRLTCLSKHKTRRINKPFASLCCPLVYFLCRDTLGKYDTTFELIAVCVWASFDFLDVKEGDTFSNHECY